MMIIYSFYFRILAFIEFLYGSYQKSKEMGSTWIEEMREELKFAMICHGNTKVRVSLFIQSNKIIKKMPIILDIEK